MVSDRGSETNGADPVAGAYHFLDDKDDSLTYEVEVAAGNRDKLTAMKGVGKIVVTGVKSTYVAATTNNHVGASLNVRVVDSGGLPTGWIEGLIKVRVNSAPTASVIPDVTLPLEQEDQELGQDVVDLSAYLKDAESNALTYRVKSSAPTVASVAVTPEGDAETDGLLTVTANRVGTATITVTATETPADTTTTAGFVDGSDGMGQSVEQTFTVVVVQQ